MQDGWNKAMMAVSVQEHCKSPKDINEDNLYLLILKEPRPLRKVHHLIDQWDRPLYLSGGSSFDMVQPKKEEGYSKAWQ